MSELEAALHRWVPEHLNLIELTRADKVDAYQALYRQLEQFCDEQDLDPGRFLPGHVRQTLALAGTSDLCPVVNERMVRCQKHLTREGIHAGGHFFATRETMELLACV